MADALQACGPQAASCVGRGTFGCAHAVMVPLAVSSARRARLGLPRAVLAVAKVVAGEQKHMWHEHEGADKAARACALVVRPLLSSVVQPPLGTEGGMWRDGRLVMVMEPGVCTVTDVMRRLVEGRGNDGNGSKGGAEMTEDALRHMAACMVACVARVAEARIIHGDIKPDNFLVCGNGECAGCQWQQGWCGVCWVDACLN